MQLERKTLSLCHLKALDAKQGIVEAVVSVFNNVDQADETVLPGFFTESLAKKLPKGVWMHQWDTPVAKTLEARELAPGDPLLPDEIRSLGGLYVKGQFNLKTQRGREAFEDLDFGTVDEFSIGYLVTEERTDKSTGVRQLVKGTLYEWSPVLVGCNPATALLGVKGQQGQQGQSQPMPDTRPAAPAPAPATTAAAPATKDAPAKPGATGDSGAPEAKVVKSVKTVKSVTIGETEVKSVYLGEYVENRVTLQALSTLADALYYNVFYDCVMGDWEYDDESGDWVRVLPDSGEGAATLRAACEEFTDLVCACYTALMALGGKEAVDAVKTLRTLTPEPAPATGGAAPAAAATKFAIHSETALATVAGFIERAAAVKAIRVKEGRVLSAATRERLAAHLTSLQSACQAVEDLLEEGESAAPADAGSQDGSASSDGGSGTVSSEVAAAEAADGKDASPDAETKAAKAAAENEANAAYARFLELGFTLDGTLAP